MPVTLTMDRAFSVTLCSHEAFTTEAHTQAVSPKARDMVRPGKLEPARFQSETAMGLESTELVHVDL